MISTTSTLFRRARETEARASSHATPPHLCLVQHIVVNERGHVDHLCDGAQLPLPRVLQRALQLLVWRVTHCSAHQADNGGPEALAVAPLKEVLRCHAQHWVLRVHQLLDGVCERGQVFLDHFERVEPWVGRCLAGVQLCGPLFNCYSSPAAVR
eukprot:8674-Heterococcus_DN1.PRE.1